MFDPCELMDLAIHKAREGVAAGQSPFGCAVASGHQILAVTHNTVLSGIDITAHAEVNAIRAACQRQGGHDKRAPPIGTGWQSKRI